MKMLFNDIKIENQQRVSMIFINFCLVLLSNRQCRTRPIIGPFHRSSSTPADNAPLFDCPMAGQAKTMDLFVCPSELIRHFFSSTFARTASQSDSYWQLKAY